MAHTDTSTLSFMESSDTDSDTNSECCEFCEIVQTVEIEIINKTNSILHLESSHFAEGKWFNSLDPQYIEPGEKSIGCAGNYLDIFEGVKGGVEFEIEGTGLKFYIGFESDFKDDYKSFIGVDKNKSAEWACEQNSKDSNKTAHCYYLSCSTELKKFIFRIRKDVILLKIINNTPYGLCYKSKFVEPENTLVEQHDIAAYETETIVVSDPTGCLGEVTGGFEYTIDGQQLLLYFGFYMLKNGNYKTFMDTDNNKSAQWACRQSRADFYDKQTADNYYLLCFLHPELKSWFFYIRKDVIFLKIINSTPYELSNKDKFVEPKTALLKPVNIKAYDTKTIEVTNSGGILEDVAFGFEYFLNEEMSLYIGFCNTQNGNYKTFIDIDRNKSAQWACEKTRANANKKPSANGYFLSCSTEGSAESKFKKFVFTIRKEDAASFIKLKFVQRECKAYVRQNKSKSKACQCGRTREWHKNKGIDVSTEDTKWKPETHTKTVPCDSFGEISFKDFDDNAQTSSVPYVRLDSETNPEKVWELLMKYWKLPVPKLLISVTGGAKHFDVKSEMKDILKQALCHAATSTGAWIITGGTGTGIMKMVGEAVNDFIGKQNENIVTLGIVTWGIVSKRSALETKEHKKSSSATYDFKDIPKNAKDAPLDHHHSHFLLVDDGSENRYGRERKFRGKFVKYISQKSEPVTVVTLVVGGGVNTMATVRESVKENIPVFIIEGTGGAADFISEGYKLTETSENIELDRKMKDYVQEKFIGDEISQKCCKYLNEILDRRNLVTLLKLETEESINQEVPRALIKAKKLDAKTQLKLAVEWNCCDIARNEILSQENRKKLEEKELYEPMMTALVENRVDFVKLFIECGVSIKMFLTIKNLHSLYHNLYKKESEFFNLLIHNIRDTWTAYFFRKSTDIDKNFPDLLRNVGKLIDFLLKQQSFDFYTGKKYTVHDERDDHSDENKFETIVQDILREENLFGQRKENTSGDLLPNPEQDLFIWAVLFNRREMAELFWKRGKDQLGTAMIGFALLKSLSEEAENKGELELCKKLTEHAKFFETLSKKLLSECYDVDKDVTYRLLLRELPSWGNLTLLKIADTYEMMDFMEHSSCQIKLNSIWKGQMEPHTSVLKIFLCIFFPIFLPLIKFTSNDKSAIISKRWISSNRVEDESASDTSGSPKTQNDYHRVTLFGNENTINILYAWRYFCTAPVTKFLFNVLSYVVFLAIFSYFVLVDVRPMGEPQSPSMWEVIVWIWIVTMINEEIRQVFFRSECSFKYNIQNWFSNLWNKFDLLMYIMFILCFILRWSVNDADFIWARRMYSLTLIMFYLRSLQFLLVAKNIGPKVIMIREMLIDLLYFLSIFLVFVVSFGIAYHINMYPNSPQSWTILSDVLLMPYFQMYGELFLERVEADWLSTLLLAVYMLLTNILLVNLLIAMFSYTFKTIQDKSMKVWRFHRFALITEYRDCPNLVPPLIIFEHLFQFIRWMLHKTSKTKEKNEKEKNEEENEEEKNKDNKKLTQFEKVATNRYLSRTDQFERQKRDNGESKTKEHSVLDETEDDFRKQTNEKIDKIIKMLTDKKKQTPT